jgi:lysophospholipid acyltransferase (LPLAT)-like uncharacterized protein
MRTLTFKHRLVAAFMLMVLKLIFKTCRVRLKGIEHFEKTIGEGSAILSFWHDSMAIVPPIFNRFCLKTKFIACISNSRDGDWLHAVVSRFPQADSIRIGHRARARGLLEMIREVEKGNRTLLITPDGPKGPPKTLKEGILEVSRKTGTPILPVSWKSSFTFRFRTWDRFRVPLPFSTIEVIISPPATTAEAIQEGMNLYP